MATKQVIYEKRQGNGYPDIIHVEMVFNQKKNVNTATMIRAEEAFLNGAL